MQINARPYQTGCVSAMFDSMMAGKEYGLVALPTGAGKTIIFSLFVEQVYKRYSHLRNNIRICILAHREKLISQARDKLLKVWPEAAPKIGMACASTGEDINVDSEIVIGSIQTMTSRLKSRMIEPFDIVLIDEGHRIPERENIKNAYSRFLTLTAQLSPRRKVFAFTATPFRLGHGYIYGDACKPTHTNWFKELTFTVPMGDLIDAGYLVNYRIKQAIDIGPELRSVPLASTGDYKTDALGTIMCKFNMAAVNAWRDYGEKREHIVAFCATINHAEKVAASFTLSGIPAAAIHSKLSDDERRQRFDDFASGKLKLLASVDVLIEGWDETSVDCILMLRPTKAPMIYVQQVGRGLRLHPGKENLLILDLADNLRNHGFPDAPQVKIPGMPIGGEAPVKICPDCQLAIPAQIMKCPECGHVFVPRIYREPNRLTLEEIERTQEMRYTKAKPTLAKIEDIQIYRDTGRVHLHLTFKDPVTKRNSWCNVFLNDWKLDKRVFADEWFALTNLDTTPKTMDEMFSMLADIDWPKYGYFHRENPGGARYANLCGWEREGWTPSFPEIRYNDEPTNSSRIMSLGNRVGQLRTTRERIAPQKISGKPVEKPAVEKSTSGLHFSRVPKPAERKTFNVKRIGSEEVRGFAKIES